MYQRLSDASTHKTIILIIERNKVGQHTWQQMDVCKCNIQDRDQQLVCQWIYNAAKC